MLTCVLAPSVLTLSACETDKCKGECAAPKLSTTDADAAPSTRTSPAQLSTTSQSDTPSSESRDAGALAPQLFSCRNDNDCLATPFPACSLPLRQCVTCTQNAHCGAEKPLCTLLASDDLNRCVECQSGSDCASGLCQDDACLTCDPNTNQGCEVGICLATDEQSPHCVQCVDDDDCSAGVCIDHECKTCDVRTSAGCSEGTVCLPRSEVEPNQVLDSSAPAIDAGAAVNDPLPIVTDGICVECADSRPCADPDLSVCLNNTCVACDPSAASENGCTPSTPFCFVGSEPAADVDSGATAARCVECLVTSDCENAQCVDHVCQPCDPTTHAGCTDGDICVPRPRDNTQQAIAYECVECNDEKACAGALHCGSDHQCHECLESSHCPKSTKPICQSNGECGKCTSDDQCPSDAPQCAQDTGECVECEKDEHCSDSPAGSACAVAWHRCVECTETNLDACDGNPCLLLGQNAYTCLDESLPDGGASTECKRCTTSADCDATTECAVLGDANLRCVPLASTVAGRTDCDVQEAQSSEGETRSYCVPFGC